MCSVRVHVHAHTGVLIDVRATRTRTYTNTTWSTPIRARAAPFVLKLEVTKRILTSLATSFYSPAFRPNVQRGFSMARTSARREKKGEKRKKEQDRMPQRGSRDDEQGKEYEGRKGRKETANEDERAPGLITNKCPCRRFLLGVRKRFNCIYLFISTVETRAKTPRNH